MAIDQSISPSAINANELAIIEKYGFDVKDDSGYLVVIDPTYRKANGGKGGRYGGQNGGFGGGNIGGMLAAAVKNRQALEGAAKAPSDKPKPATKVKGNGNVPETDPKAETVTVAKAASASRKRVTVEPKDNASKNVTPTGNAANAPSSRKSANSKASKKADKKEKAVKPAKVRGDNRYLRAARVISGNPNITAKALSKEAAMSESMAANCLLSWQAVIVVLDNRKALAVKAADLLSKTDTK